MTKVRIKKEPKEEEIMISLEQTTPDRVSVEVNGVGGLVYFDPDGELRLYEEDLKKVGFKIVIKEK